MADIFFIYDRTDEARARAIAEALEKGGLTVQWDRTLLPGERYDTVMPRRLGEAKAAVVLWSRASLASSLIMDEAAAARDTGKLVPVRIEPVDAPLGFRQLQTADLANWPNVGDSLRLLGEALSGMMTGPAARPFVGSAVKLKADDGAIDAVEGTSFLKSKAFWGWTFAIALFEGLLYFVSPAGQREMGADTATRVGTLIGNVLGMFLILMFARALIYWSRNFVGKPTRRYFGVEMIVLWGLAIVLAGFSMTQPEVTADAGTGVFGFAHQLNFMSIGIIMFGAPLFFVIRGLLRLVRGKPQPA